MGAPLLTALLFLGAVIGHTCLVVLSHNRWYGAVLPRRASDAVQVIHGLLVLAGPVAFCYFWGFDLTTAFHSSSDGSLQLIGAGYLVLCWLVGFVVLPAEIIRRQLRRRPAVLVSNHTHTVDVATRLGYRPSGEGKYRLLARLPGNEVFQVDFAERLLPLPRLPAA